jgi:uncharacterized OB-fold protein
MSRKPESSIDHLDGSVDFARWAIALRDGRLLGQRCNECDNIHCTPKAGCIVCGNRALTAVELPNSGSVYSSSLVRVAPQDREPGYRIGVVHLDDTNGAHILARIPYESDIGDAVELVDSGEHDGIPYPVFG